MLFMKFCTDWRMKFTKLTKFRVPKKAKTAVLELLDSPKLISRKIWVIENHEISTLCSSNQHFSNLVFMKWKRWKFWHPKSSDKYISIWRRTTTTIFIFIMHLTKKFEPNTYDDVRRFWLLNCDDNFTDHFSPWYSFLVLKAVPFSMIHMYKKQSVEIFLLLRFYVKSIFEI